MPEPRRTVALGEFLAQSSISLQVDEDTEYRQVTVRTKGQGVTQRAVLPGSKIKTKRQFCVTPNQLIVSKIDARNGALGLVPEALDGAIVTQDFPVFSVDARVCIPEFLRLMTSRPSFWEECFAVSEGSTNRVRLNIPEFLDLEVELPGLETQRRIVNAVKQATRAEQAAEAERGAAFAALQALLDNDLHAEGDWDALPAGWRLCTLADVSDVRSGITKGRKTKEPLTSLPFIRAANVQGGYLNLGEIKDIEVTGAEATRFALQHGDVLMIEGGNAEHLGRGWLWEGQAQTCLHQNHVFRARPNAKLIVPRFLAYAIAATPARRYCLEHAKRTTNLASINKTQISAMPVPVPPMEVQRSIVKRLDVLRSAGVRAERYRDQVSAVKAAMIEELVTGSTELPAEIPAIAA